MFDIHTSGSFFMFHPSEVIQTTETENSYNINKETERSSNINKETDNS